VPERDLDFEYLADWANGRLPEAEARAVEERLESADEATRADAAWLRSFSSISRGIVIEDPPAEQREELSSIFEAYAEGRRGPGPLRRLVATLSQGGLQPLAGVRSAASRGAQGQLIYSTAVADIAINFRRRPGGGLLDLDGQIFPNDDSEPEAFGVQILSGTDEVATDELGEFAFEGVAPGEYQILVSSEEVEILISPVDLRT
jgi:hypothetical protein